MTSGAQSGRAFAALATRARKGRFTLLAVILVTVFLIVGTIANDQLREALGHTAFSGLLLFTIWAVEARYRKVTMVLVAPALLSLWILHVSGSHASRFVGFSLSFGFLVLLTGAVLFAVLRDTAVTADTIVGAMCAYLLLGLTWGSAYALVALHSPHAFAVAPSLQTTAPWDSPTSPMAPLLHYFSFVTLSTLGYGDITPVSPLARALAVLEGMVGQLYVAVLIARLVGIHTAGSQRT